MAFGEQVGEFARAFETERIHGVSGLGGAEVEFAVDFIEIDFDLQCLASVLVFGWS